MSDYVVGQSVRVKNNEFSRVGTIACLNDDQTVDIVYSSKKNGASSVSEDSDGVSLINIQPLEPFEYELESNIKSRNSVDPNQLKEYGNILFGLKDYDRAAELYLTSLSSLERTCNQLSVGTEVLVQVEPNSLDFTPAMIISEEDNGILEVEYDIEGSEPESRINKSSVIAFLFHNKSEQNPLANRILQRSLYLNLSRCCMKRSRPGWAVRWASLSMAVTHSIGNSIHDSTDIDLAKYKIDELFIRCKALIMAWKLDLAMKDALALQKLGDKKSLHLIQEIKSLKTQRRVSNAKLVKAVMSWVDSSMNQINQPGGSMDMSSDLAL